MKKPISLTDIERLPPMPGSVQQLAQLVNQPEASLIDFVRVLEYDQSLTARVLRWANSAWSRTQVPITTVREAVIRLGQASILKLAIGSQVAGQLKKPLAGYQLAGQELWRHSIAAALAAENLAAFVQSPIPGAAFTAALLHDIGKMILNQQLDADTLEEIRELTADGRMAYVDAEFQVLGTDHAQIGGEIARHWKFPLPLVQGIAFHHTPDKMPEPLMDAVHIANMTAKFIGTGLGSEQMNLDASFDSARRLGLTIRGLEALCARVQTDLEKESELWSA